MSTPASAAAARTAISPYARRLARERSVPIERLRGSGPRGRIVGADVIAYVMRPVSAPLALAAPATTSSFGTTIAITAITRLLDDFAGAGHDFQLVDAALRALGCALVDMPDLAGPADRPVALELGRRQAVFADLHRRSLAPLAARRIEVMASDADDAAAPAMISLRILASTDIRPVLMPLLGDRPMRLVLAAGARSAEALLAFDAARVSEDLAAALLGRFKKYLDEPLLLLA